MKNLIWVRQAFTNFGTLAKLNGPFSSYKKAEKFLLKVGDGTIVTESLEDAKVRVAKQATESYDRTNTEKLLVGTLEAMAVEPKQKKVEVVKPSVEGPKRQVAKRTPIPAKKKVEVPQESPPQ